MGVPLRARLLTGLCSRCVTTQTRAKYLWWGRYLTQFQMAQFLANLVQARQRRGTVQCASRVVLTPRCPACRQAAYCLRYSPYPRFMSNLLLWYMCSLLFLFGAAAPPAWRHTVVRADARPLLPRAAGSFYYSKHVAPKKGAAAKGGKKRQ